MTSEQKAVVFAELDVFARVLVRKIPQIPPHELSNWMYVEMVKAVEPYVQRGISRDLLIWHFGLLVGEHLSAVIL